MGMRTVVILQNDLSHLWASNHSLGAYILSQSNSLQIGTRFHLNEEAVGVNVVQCANDMQQTLGLLKGYSMQTLAQISHPDMSTKVTLELVKACARNLGYTLVKKR